MNLDGLRLVLDARRALRGGPGAAGRRQRVRLRQIVAYARRHSPYFRDAYRDLPEQVTDPRHLPVTSKKALMERFDDWVTDPAVTLDGMRGFVANPDLVGEKFADRKTVLSMSGTTGARGLFVWDERTLAVTNALALRMLGAWLGPKDVARILAGRGRFAMVMASGSHFASATAAARLAKPSASGSRRSPSTRRSATGRPPQSVPASDRRAVRGHRSDPRR